MSPNSINDQIAHSDPRDHRQFTQSHMESKLIEQTPTSHSKHHTTGNIFSSACQNDNNFKHFETKQQANFTASNNMHTSTNNNPIINSNTINKSSLNKSGDMVSASTENKKEERLDRMAWFHGLLTRENAEKLLVKDGDYLVRETNKAEKQYVLSGRYKGECRHIFLVDPSGVVSSLLYVTFFVISSIIKRIILFFSQGSHQGSCIRQHFPLDPVSSGQQHSDHFKRKRASP